MYFGQQCAFICSQAAYNVNLPYKSTCIIPAGVTGEGLVGTNICCITVCVTANSFPQLTLGVSVCCQRQHHRLLTALG